MSTNKDYFSAGLAKVLEEQWQADIRLKAGDSDEGSSIPAHKLILASRSEVLKMMLESDEDKTSTVNIKKSNKKQKTSTEKVETVTLSEMKQEELKALVEFLYSDGSMLSAKAKQHVRSLYLAGDKYMILQLRDLCRNELISTMNSANALDFLELAPFSFDKVLYDAAFLYIKKNIYTIGSSETFRLFVVRNPNIALDLIKAFLPRLSGQACHRCRAPYIF